MIQFSAWKHGSAVLLVMTTVGCARSGIRPMYHDREAALARPDQILVYTFAVSAAEVTENQGLFGRLAKGLSTTTSDERELEVGRQVADRMAADLVAGIRELGVDAVRADRSTTVAANALLVTGQFLNLDEGNRLRRLVIGFGAGASKVDTSVQVLTRTTSGDRTVLEFTTHADSGKMPGAAVTMGAGAAAQGGATAGMAAAHVAIGGAKAYRSTLDAMAGRSADQAVAYLSEFFGKQGWIPPDKVKRAHTVEPP